MKSLVCLFILNASLIFADEIQENSQLYRIADNGKIERNDWVKLPITVPYEEDKAEKVEIQFPSTPTFINGLQSPCITATDEEGMKYIFSRMLFPEENFNLHKSVDFVVESIKKSPNKKLAGFGYPQNDLKDSGYMISYVKDDEMRRMVFIKSAHLVYCLEVSSHNEIYRDLESIEMGTEAFEILMNDAYKASAFFHSLEVDGVSMMKDALQIPSNG